MEVHNADLYHCQKCGRVERRVGEVEAPICCNQQMAKAGKETIAVEAKPAHVGAASGSTGADH